MVGTVAAAERRKLLPSPLRSPRFAAILALLLVASWKLRDKPWGSSAPRDTRHGSPLSGRGAKADAGLLDTLPWEPLLGLQQLRRGLAFYGGGRSIERVAARLLAGQPITAVTLGGSVTKGFGSSDSNVTSYPAMFFRYLNATFPHRGHVFLNKGLSATTSGIFAACAKQMVPPETDLVVVEFSCNDGPWPDFLRPERRGFERLLRTLALLPRSPAVIVLHHFAWWYASGPGQDTGVFYALAEGPLSTLAQYYDMPSPSLRNAVYQEMLADVAPFKAGASQKPGVMCKGAPMPQADPQQVQDYFYLDSIHPGDKGHQALAELLAGVVQTAVRHVVADGRMAEGGEAAASLAPAPLPPPMIVGNADVPTTLCAMQEDFKPLARAMQGFEYRAERPDRPTFVEQKWGFRGDAPGAWLELELSTEEAPGHTGNATVLLGHLSSYEGMGLARVECTAGCTCDPTEVDGMWKPRVSLQQLHALPVTQHPGCVLRITILPRNSSSGGGDGGGGDGSSGGSGSAGSGGSGGASGSKFQVSALVVAHQPVEVQSQTAQVEGLAAQAGGGVR